MTRCVALDMEGIRCRNKAVGLFAYHGNSEIYPDSVPTLVAADLCKSHSGEMGSKYREKDYAEALKRKRAAGRRS